MGLLRRTSVPADVRATLPLKGGERVLAGALGREGGWYVGTTQALLLPDVDGFRRLGWERVERAEWDRDHDVLVVVETADFGEREPRHRLAMDDPNRLLEVVFERIIASVVLKRYVGVEANRGLTVVARRSPHTDGPLAWSFVVDRGLDATSPAVREAAERGLAEARAEIGG